MKLYRLALSSLLLLSSVCLSAQDTDVHESVDPSQNIPEGMIVGETVSPFFVRDIQGETFGSKEALRDGPLVLVFFQGSWNGEDIKFLFDLNDSLKVLEDHNAQVLALSMEKERFIKLITKKKEVGFRMAHDVDGRLSKQFDLIYTVNDAYTKQMMQKGNINFHERYSDETILMSAPTVMVISQSGKIIFNHMDFDTSSRPFVNDLARALSEPGEERREIEVLDEGGSEPVKKKRRRRKKN